MTDPLTSAVIVAAAIAIIAFDIWIVWKRGGTSTVSWVLETWWTARPLVMVSVFVLMGHIFFPTCLPDGVSGTQSIGPGLGSDIGAVGCIGLATWLIYIVKLPALPNGPVVTRGYLFRLAALALLGMAAGHFAFTQYIQCQ